MKRMVGPNGFEPSTSSVSRKRSRPTELRAYDGAFILTSASQDEHLEMATKAGAEVTANHGGGRCPQLFAR
jgi:hypothetical protein